MTRVCYLPSIFFLLFLSFLFFSLFSYSSQICFPLIFQILDVREILSNFQSMLTSHYIQIYQTSWISLSLFPSLPFSLFQSLSFQTSLCLFLSLSLSLSQSLSFFLNNLSLYFSHPSIIQYQCQPIGSKPREQQPIRIKISNEQYQAGRQHRLIIYPNLQLYIQYNISGPPILHPGTEFKFENLF